MQGRAQVGVLQIIQAMVRLCPARGCAVFLAVFCVQVAPFVVQARDRFFLTSK